MSGGGSVLEMASVLVGRRDLRIILADDPEALADHDADVARLRALAQDCSVRGPAGYEVAGAAALAVLTTTGRAITRVADHLEPEPARIFVVLAEELERLRLRYARKLGLGDAT